MEKPLLPVVTKEVFDASLEARRHNSTRADLDRIQKTNPLIEMVISSSVAYAARNDVSPSDMLLESMLVLYNLLETQAAADRAAE